ncbi:NAD(P)/FAD-dependent oxidoreductase [Actinomadura scrupuli]|uniref:NAD(P)/FAD-dependent oxidoreductase n=1 Tax=Actinomadura scrupuli TaxID=559629 RepID=UPI003D96F567
MSPDQKTYDIIILGSGLAGSMLGSVLARRGADVLILDARSHPRPAQGETVSPRAAAALRALAERYGVPEIKTLTTYDNCSQIINCTFGVRRHFGFMLHEAGRPQDPHKVNQATNGPLEDPAHLYRQDSDAYLFHAAVRYGCDTRQNYRVSGIDADAAGVTVHGADGSSYQGSYLVDTAGRQSPAAKAFGVRDETPRFRHRSRSLSTHLIGVRDTDEVYAGRRSGDVPPKPWHSGTMSHLFDHGWVSVVPFDNEPRSRNRRCSVTLTLDPRHHPKDPGVSAAEEFAAYTARFPDLARQFEHALPVREWEVTEEVQYSSSRVTGDRWCLIGESAGFVDPLFARDLSDTAEVINVLAWRLLRAIGDGDFSAERFAYVEQLQQGLLDFDDQLVDSAYSAFSDYPLWNAVFRIWAWGTGAGTFRLQEAMARFLSDGRDEHFTALEDVPYPGFFWPDHDGYKKLFEEMVARCQAYDAGLVPGGEAAAELYDAIGQSNFFPKYLGFAEPEVRFLHPTPKAIVKSLRWASRQADPELKRLLVGNMKHVVRSKLRRRLGSA